MNVPEGDVLKNFDTAIILAGGKSSRMGFDKQFLRLNEIRLMDIAASKLKQIFNQIIIVTNKPEEYENTPYTITEDIIPGKGPLSGIHAGLSISMSRYAYVIACDMPNIDLDYIQFMKTKVLDSDGCVTRYKDTIEPFNGFYSIDLIKGIEDYLNENRKSAVGFISESGFIYIDEEKAREYSPNWDMFANLNTVEDLKQLTMDS